MTYTGKFIKALSSLLFLFISFNSEDLNAQNRPGILYLSDGSIQEFLFVGANTDTPIDSRTITVNQGDNRIRYEVWDFKKIEFIEPQFGTLLGHTIDDKILRYDSYSTRIAGRASGNVYFTILDQVTGKRKVITHLPGNTLKAVEFDVSTGPGGFMINPRTNSQFPIYYKYDPYTGEKLEPQTVFDHDN